MFEKLTYESLIRIFAWSIFFLLVLSAALPRTPVHLRYADEMSEQGIIPVMTERGDPRWSNPNTLPNGPKKTDIIWVAGSSVLIPPREFPEEGEEEIYDHLPARVKNTLDAKHHISSTLRLSILPARRALGTYTMTLDALARKPDMLVVAINPFWDFNEQSLYFKRNIFNAGLPLWVAHGDWKLTALARPAHLLWAFIGDHIPVLRDAHDRMNAVKERFENHPLFSPLDENVTDPHLFVDIKYDQPLIFWIIHRVLGGDTDSIEQQPGKFNAKMWQLLTLQSMRTNKQEGWADFYMQKMLGEIHKSGKPALVYLAPLSESVTYQDAAYDNYTKVHARMSELKKQYETNNLKIITTMPREVEFSLSHVDFLHLNTPGKLPDYLAGEIAGMIKEKQ